MQEVLIINHSVKLQVLKPKQVLFSKKISHAWLIYFFPWAHCKIHAAPAKMTCEFVFSSRRK